MSFSECDNAFCPNSHLPLCYDRAELAPQAGYIVYADFIHALSVVFGPKFIWKYELYIEKLYEAYGTDQQVVSRHVSYVVLITMNQSIKFEDDSLNFSRIYCFYNIG